MLTYYQNTVGVTISLALKENGGPVSLASRTATIYLYAFGTNILSKTWVATVDDAANGLAHYTLITGDFGTVGDFFSIITVAGTGYSQTFVGDSYKIVTAQQSSVTVNDLLQFMQIPQSNAKDSSTIQLYIDQADKQLLLETPSLAAITNPDIIQFRLHVVRLAAAVYYFMNLSEDNVNPEIRLEKIKIWMQLYKEAKASLVSALATTVDTTSTSSVRRITNTSVSDISPLSSSYTP